MTCKPLIRTLALLLAAVLTFSLVVCVLPGEAGAATSVSSLEKKQEKLAAQIKALEKQLAQAKKDQASALKQKNLLSSQISAYQEDIDNTNSLIAAYEKQIDEQQQLIVLNTADYDDLYEKLKDRIRVMYENGDVSYLEVLLTSANISDLVTRADMVNAIVGADRKKLNELLEARARIEEAKAKLEATKTGLEEKKSELSAKKNTLAQKQSEADRLLSQLSSQVTANKENLIELEKEEEKVAKEIAAAAKAAAGKKQYVGGTFSWPLPGYTRISSYFGMRVHPITKKYKLHTGIDLPAPKGTAILSANYGTVIKAQYNTAYGNFVMVDHGGGKVTLYAHMSKMSVKKGDEVAKNQKLGEVGTTGYSTGNHLHFEIIINGSQVNPLNYYTLK
ncbi:MAG: peptidoglycan DD-metalloendopeptidase family protein [Clostridia bacterium]|nr:peptidoglycan DD-metalloendopeptidase family protein [Clostridia bacterium]